MKGGEDEGREGRGKSWRGHKGGHRTRGAHGLTISSIRSEGDEDLKLLVGVLDGGQGEEGVGRLPEIGDHVLCRDSGVRRGGGHQPHSHPSLCPSVCPHLGLSAHSKLSAGHGGWRPRRCRRQHPRGARPAASAHSPAPWHLLAAPPPAVAQRRGVSTHKQPPQPLPHPPSTPPSHLAPGDLWHWEARCQARQNSC